MPPLPESGVEPMFFWPPCHFSHLTMFYLDQTSTLQLPPLFLFCFMVKFLKRAIYSPFSPFSLEPAPIRPSPPTALLHWNSSCPESPWLNPTVSSQSSSYLTQLITPFSWKLYFPSRTLHSSFYSVLTGSSFSLSSLRMPLGLVHGPLLFCLSTVPAISSLPSVCQ